MKSIKCPNKNLSEWKELSNIVGENQAYYLWDLNNGYSLDKAPNGEPSKLFSDLLSHFNGDRGAAINTKAKVYSRAFRNWFGDWLGQDKTNVSKVVDDNGEPLMVYHGGALNITAFRIQDNGSYYEDRQTGEHIPVDSARTVFFSDNPYVGQSYGTLYAINTFKDLYTKVLSLISTTYEGVGAFDKGVFKTKLAFYDTLQALSKFNPRFGALKEYLTKLQQIGKRLNVKEVGAFRGMLLDIRDKIRSLSSDYLMNRPDWNDAFNRAKGILDEYNTPEGILRLKNGEIPQTMREEYEIYQKINNHRKRLGLTEVANYQEVSIPFSNIIGNSRYWITYDGKKLSLSTPNGTDPNVTDLSEQQIKQFFDEAAAVRELSVNNIALEEETSTLREYYQVYPTFLNIRNPLVHDYEGTHMGQGYKESPTNSFGYVAARQVNKAIKDGNDGVVYQNIYDPILANNYAVFSPNQIKSLYNQGTFSAGTENIYARVAPVENPFTESRDEMVHKIGEFTNSALLIDYLLRQDGISNRTKKLLARLRKHATLLILHDFVPERVTGTTAFYNGAINLYVDRLREASMLDIAEDVAHEMLHHYLLKLFETDATFADHLTRIRDKYKNNYGGIKSLYGMRDGDSAIEFLNEFMSSDHYRNQLRFSSNNLFRYLLNYLTAILRKFVYRGIGKAPVLQSDLVDLDAEIYRLLDKVNQGELETYSVADYPLMARQERLVDPEQQKEVDRIYDKIQKGLSARLKSVKRYQQKNPRLWNELGTLISQLGNSEAEQGMLQFVLHIQDSISDAILFLNRPIADINAKQIRQLSQDYVGFYKPLLDDILSLLDTTDLLKTNPNYPDILAKIQALSLQMSSINNRFNHVLRQKGKEELVNFLKNQNVPQEFIDLALNFLDNPSNDVSFFTNFFGMASNSDIMVVQAIAHILNNVMNETSRATTQKGILLTKLAEAAKKKYGVDVLKLLYEKDKDGNYTGYIVRPYNYGQYLKDKREYLDKLAAKLGIKKDKNGMYDVPADESIQKQWLDGLNKFYSDRVNRRYTAEYYATRNSMLSMKTREALDEVLDAIDSILSRVFIDGIEHSELLTDAEFIQLNQLRKLKQLLANMYNLDGSVKTGDDLLIAKELLAFNEKVNKNVKYEVDLDAYNRDLAKIILQYGGNKNDPRVLKWIARNTKQRYTQSFYDRLDALDHVPQTKLYEDLVLKRRQLLQLFRNPETGLVDASMMSDTEREALRQLDEDIAKERTIVQGQADPYRDKFKNFAEIATTDEYLRDWLAALNQGQLAFNDWYFKNHYEDAYGNMQPASYYTTLRPIQAVADMYTETVPTGRYTRIDPNSNWANPNYDPNGPTLQLNMKYYDNSAAYKAITDKPELKALYDEVVNTMTESMAMIPFMNNANDGRMPLIHARLALVMARMNGLTDRAKYLLDEVVTTQPEDLDYVEEFDTMPNGDPIRVIPTRFINMLDDPNTISTDAVASVTAFYNMAMNYHNMSNKRDDVELLLNLLASTTMLDRSRHQISGKNSNVYKQAQLLVDRLMYGRNMSPLNVTLFGKQLNVSKLLGIIRNFITKVNLSGNIWSIGTSLLTDVGYSTIESKLGRYFDNEDLQFSIKEYYRRLPKMMENLGQPVPRDKVAALMLLNQVVKDNREVFNRIDQSKVLRAINNNFWYAGYTMSDYYVKSHTLMSIYHNYRFYNGEFLSKAEFINKYYANDKKKGEVAFKQLDITLFDVYDEEGNVYNQYKQYVTNTLLNKVKNRIDVLSRRVDGTLREVDKAAIHANALGQYIVMHKNFMIQGIHDRFKKRQFNLDTGMIEEGYYRSTARFLKNVVGNRHFALTQLLADYNQLSDEEQYAVKRVLFETMLITSTTLVALSLAALVDGDDDWDNWLMQSITYLALRSSFEFRTMYNPMEFVALIKSPSAATSWFENASAFINLFNPYSYIGLGGPFSLIDRGVYEGMPRILRNVIKVTPVRSLIEAQDPKSKRNYLQNQLMSF